MVLAIERLQTLRRHRNFLAVGISEMKVSREPGDLLVTHSLGSCIGLTLYDPVARVGGMVRCMLPLSDIDPDKAERKPCLFIDTGVTALLEELDEMGASRQELVAKVAGAGSLRGGEDGFRTGQRNYTVLRKVLWKTHIPIDNEDIGGSRVRTLYLDMSDGRTVVVSDGKEVVL